MLQFHFALLLECIFVEGVLEVFQAENAVNWGMIIVMHPAVAKMAKYKI